MRLRRGSSKPTTMSCATTRRRLSKGRRSQDAVVARKVRKLQRIIPGGQRMQVDRLFLQTADYILHMRLQIHLLQTIFKLYSPHS
ncbi:hypothetical protein BVRB_6g149290 [Beta vulgaris subsp. vulgaris]|nr:hypothetical protein BVRB_6g149290 [Beta vulgaris subsp. vulgaris]